jgi:hypothetical protein
VGLPQVWPRTDQTALNPPHARYIPHSIQSSVMFVDKCPRHF